MKLNYLFIFTLIFTVILIPSSFESKKNEDLFYFKIIIIQNLLNRFLLMM